MNTSIFIPKRINVGYQKRNDTYTGKLAYVTYFDEKHCREYGCIYYDPDVILCCKRNFKDPVDGMDACCELPEIQDDGFHALLDKIFS